MIIKIMIDIPHVCHFLYSASILCAKRDMCKLPSKNSNDKLISICFVWLKHCDHEDHVNQNHNHEDHDDRSQNLMPPQQWSAAILNLLIPSFYNLFKVSTFIIIKILIKNPILMSESESLLKT